MKAFCEIGLVVLESRVVVGCDVTEELTADVEWISN